jgi:hypothetical protein
MPRTAFDPKTHGFAFVNSWQFDDTERERLRDIFSEYLKWGTILGAASFGLGGALLALLGILALRNKIEKELAQGYGLCGGMAFTALDYYLASVPLPRGEHARDRPAGGTPLRSYLWKRQIDSLVKDLDRFLAWLIFLHYIPSFWPFGGGADWLLNRSHQEWQELQAKLDTGVPVPLGLVRHTTSVFENHQVLAIGYEAGESEGTIWLYEPNYPDREPTIHLEFDAQARLIRLDESHTPSPGLRGFFCEVYTPLDPREAVQDDG